MPEDVAFQTRPQLARRMLERAVESGVPFSWVTGDEIYGSDCDLRLWLERAGIPHLLAIKSNEKLWAWTEKGPLQVRAARLAAQVEESGWLPAHHPGDAGSCLSGGGPASCGSTGMGWRKGGCPGSGDRLIPLTVPEVRRLLTRLIWTAEHPPDFVLSWSRWRRRHQAGARQCHYQRRLSLLASVVRL